MLKRLLLAVALPVLAAAPVHAQTTLFASGGNVVLTPTSLNFSPFDLFLDVAGLAERHVASSDGTIFTLDTRGSVGITGFPSLGSLTLGNFAPGTSMFFRYVINGSTYTSVAFYQQQTTTNWLVEFADVNHLFVNSGGIISLNLTGIGSATGLQCPLAAGPAQCSTLTPVTSTPEPASIALFATGLAGLVPVVIRRRRAL